MINKPKRVKKPYYTEETLKRQLSCFIDILHHQELYEQFKELVEKSDLPLRLLFEPIIRVMIQQKELFTAENLDKNNIRIHFMNGYERIFYDLNKPVNHNNRLTIEETRLARDNQQRLYNEMNKARMDKIRAIQREREKTNKKYNKEIETISNQSIWGFNECQKN